MTGRLLAFDRSAAVKSLGGFIHIYNVKEPTKCAMPAEFALKATAFQGPLEAIVVALPRTAAKSIRNMLKVLGEIFSLNSSKTLYKISLKAWLPDLEKGCLMVGESPASVRPFFPEEVWRLQRFPGTVLIRGPKSEDEILERWSKLSEIKAKGDRLVQISQSESHRTWFVRSPLRKCDAGNLAPWIVMASGHCFNCGRPGHTERCCPNMKKRCRICNSTSHTAEVCEARSAHMRTDTARRYVSMIGSYLTSFKDDMLPNDLAYFLGRVSSIVRVRISRNDYRNGQQQQQQPARKQRPKSPQQPQPQQQKP